jgi:hypothetical protein
MNDTSDSNNNDTLQSNIYDDIIARLHGYDILESMSDYQYAEVCERYCDAPIHKARRNPSITKTCRYPAGYKTGHEGYGRCNSHGGRGYYVEEAWAMAITIAESLDISPWESLLFSVKRSAGLCAWLDIKLAESEREDNARYTEAMAARDLDEESKGPPPRPGPSVATYTLLQESRAERKHLSAVAKAAIDAGVAERLIRNITLEGDAMAEALMAGLDAVNLTESQRSLIIAAAYKKLTGGDEMPIIEGTVA